MTKHKKFIIVTPSFNENIGGVIALHLLCHRINSLGREAFIWDINRPHETTKGLYKKLVYLIRRLNYERKRLKKKFITNAEWNTPEITNISKNIDDYIFIYPEIIQGNPLNASFFIRWLLYLPRHNHYSNENSKNHFNICYSESCKRNLNQLIVEESLLCATWLHPDYRESFDTNRHGIAYQIRKHDSKAAIDMPNDAIKIDGLSHREIAKIFKQVEYFYSYDLYSFYSIYASLCGCKSIVVPQEGLNEENWRPEPKDRLGLAYGPEKIEWAISTRQDLKKYISEKQSEEIQQVKSLITLCDTRFT